MKVREDPFATLAPCYDFFMRAFGLYRTEEIIGLLALEGTERVLDLGGGTGFLARRLVPLAREVHLLDLSPAMVKRVRGAKVKARVGNALNMPYATGFFDVVVLSDFLHHVRERNRLLCETVRVMRPGGRLLVHEFHGGTLRGRLLERVESRAVGAVSYTTPERLARDLGSYGFRPLSSLDRGLAFISLFLRG